MPAFPSTLSLLQSDFCLYHSIEIAHQSTTGPHAIKLNSQLLVFIHLTSRRSNGSGHHSFLFGFLSSLGTYTVLSWFSSNPVAAPLSPFLFSPLPPNHIIVIQAWRFSPHPPLFSFYILSLLSLEALNTPRVSALFVRYKVLPCSWDTKIFSIFSYLFINLLSAKLGAREVWNSDCPRLKKGDVM